MLAPEPFFEPRGTLFSEYHRIKALVELPGFVAACAILVSPPTSGTDTPLRIDSYPRSGKPIVATDLKTHTQVTGDSTAAFLPPNAPDLAAGIARLIDRPRVRLRPATAARTLAATRYSRNTYLSRTEAAYERLPGRHPSSGSVGASRSGAT